MELKSVIVNNGQVIGAVLSDKGVEKKARLLDIQKLIEKGKITAGARIIDNILYIEPEILKRQTPQQIFELEQINYDINDNIIGATLKNNIQINTVTLWSLAADNRIKNVAAAYIDNINSKAIIKS